MELRIDMDYEQVLDIVNQLPHKDIEKLKETLNASANPKANQKRLQALLRNAPTWNQADNSQYEEARTHLNKFRLI